MTSTTSPFAAACINEDAVYWLNASQQTKDYLISKGASAPQTTDDDRFVAQQRAAAAKAAAQPKTTP